MQTIKMNIVSSMVTHTMHIDYNLIGHKDTHNQKLQCTMHCNHLTFIACKSQMIKFLMKTFVGKCLFESKGQVMNACVESEGEVTKVLQKEIIDGDPLDNACVFLARELTSIVGCGNQLILFDGQFGKPKEG